MVKLWYMLKVYTYIVTGIIVIHLICGLTFWLAFYCPIPADQSCTMHFGVTSKSVCVVKIDVFNGQCHDGDEGGKLLYMWLPHLWNFQSAGITEFVVGEDL